MWAGFLLSAGGVLLCAAALVPIDGTRLDMPSPGWDQFWPVAAGIVLAGGGWIIRRGRTAPREPAIPAGDLFTVLESAGRTFSTAGIIARCMAPMRKGASGIAATIASARLRAANLPLPVVEQVIRRLPVAGACFTLLLLLLLYL
jgi:hypothetical protein